MTIWDVTGIKRKSEIYKPYYDELDVIIFVIDLFDEERLAFAQEELSLILDRDELSNVPLLIFANKQDIAKVKLDNIANRFQLENLTRPWKIQGTCATTGEGLNDGLEWIQQEINKIKKK